MYKIMLADKQNRRIIKIGSYADSLLFRALGFVVLSIERI